MHSRAPVAEKDSVAPRGPSLDSSSEAFKRGRSGAPKEGPAGKSPSAGSPRDWARALRELEKPVHFAWESEDWGERYSLCGGACAVREEDGERDVVPLLCGRWGCAVCGRLRYRWFRKNVEAAVGEHGLRYFWTLTLAHHSHTAAESWELVSRAWNRFTAVMRKRHGALTFIWVVEPQKSGHAHLHVLVNAYLDHAEVVEVWERASEGARICWVERVRSENVAGYLAKYMGKWSGHLLEVPGLGELVNKHRYGKSRDVVFSPFRTKAEGWEYLPYAFKDVWRSAHRQGRIVAFTDRWVPSLRMRVGMPADHEWEPWPDVPAWKVHGQRLPRSLRASSSEPESESEESSCRVASVVP